jgi:hypothetical protein
MKGSHLFWLSRSKGMTVDIWIRDYTVILQGVSRRKSLAGVNIMVYNYSLSIVGLIIVSLWGYVLWLFKDWWWLLSPTAGHRNCQKNLRLSKHTNMTIHWKALEEYFLMVSLVFQFNHFRGMHFVTFSQNGSVLKELSCSCILSCCEALWVLYVEMFCPLCNCLLCVLNL